MENNNTTTAQSIEPTVENSIAVDYLSNLFANGVETWDSLTRQPQNQGGAKFWLELNWRSGKRIAIHNEQLRDITRGMSVSFFACNRYQTEADGSLTTLPQESPTDEPRHVRYMQSFMLYSNLDNSPKVTQNNLRNILEAVPELAGYVFSLADHRDLLDRLGVVERIGSVDYLRGVTMRDQMTRTTKRARLDATIVFAVPSGAPDSGSIWGYVSNPAGQSNTAQSTVPSIPV
jgi:hypothetical protein